MIINVAILNIFVIHITFVFVILNGVTTASATTTQLTPAEAETTTTAKYDTSRHEKVCPGVHIRNDLKSFELLRGCTKIDGPLTIALVANSTHPYEPKDYETLEFPKLVEITEYLLFFRVQGLSTLSKLFPNLALIRGRETFSNYALIIYEMMHLQKIHLPKLVDILRGDVRIENSPNLCYVSTVDWGAICKGPLSAHFFKDNGANCNNRCPDHCRPRNFKVGQEAPKLIGDVKELGSDHNRSLFCWTGQTCQEFCQTEDGLALAVAPSGLCCSSQCAGGCFTENRYDECVACRHVAQGKSCVEVCDNNSYEYKGKCIDEYACRNITETVHQDNCNNKDDRTQMFKAIREVNFNKCQAICPVGQEEDPLDAHICKPCDEGNCKKVCTPQENGKPFVVTNVNSLNELKKCTTIDGSLEISITGGKNVLRELENTFLDLEEIRGYLKITRSSPILTLEFMRNLKIIHGAEMDRGQFRSLIILDNPNIEELFTFNQSINDQKQLTLNGKIFVHLNPKLCLHRIERLKQYASVQPWSELDVSLLTNGDKEACDTKQLMVKEVTGKGSRALLKFDNFASQMDDPRALLYYLVNYREVANGNVTIFDGRDGCNIQNDIWQAVEVSPSQKNPEEALILVKPATRYALYLKTFTILSGSTGAVSDIIYFETAPDTPGIPQQLEGTSSQDSITVNWLPPTKSNGNIEHYIITITRTSELGDFQSIDVCDYAPDVIDNRDKITQSLSKEEPNRSTLTQSVISNQNNNSSDLSGSCPTAATNIDANVHTEKVTFQNMIIDIVYLKQPCAGANSKVKKKRSIEQDMINSSSVDSNTLPRKPSDSVTSSSREDVNVKLDIPRPKLDTQSITFNETLGRVEANITAKVLSNSDGFTATITNLNHFSLYTIEVVACHGEFRKGKFDVTSTYNKCGIQAIAQIRTQPIAENDKIQQSSIIFYQANETSNENTLTWQRPERPNGVIFAYKIRYRSKQGPETWSEGCINSTTFDKEVRWVLPTLNPGTYLIGVQTLSMYAGQRFWSESVEFYIPHNMFLSAPIITLLVVITLALLAFGVASGTYYYQKKKHDSVYASVNPDYHEYVPDEWEVDKGKLTVGSQIGTGSFGMVYKGQMITEKGTCNCAIKTLPPTSTAKQRMDFLREASIMKQFDTYHVIKLLGVVSVTTPVYVIMEYMENGDLKEFLRNQREIHISQNKVIVDGIYLMAAQIADGMAFLESKKFVHRDLAARNCMVGENRLVKIGDFGLTRDIYSNDYYRREQEGRLPVRWMAPESLNDNLYTSASDVWSYGIVVWEMVTFSAYPYSGLSNADVVQRVPRGHTMSRPENCPDKLWTMMERCWKFKYRERPSFNDIIEYLLPETEGRLYPNCFYREPAKRESDSIAHSTPDENITIGAESYPLLSWPSNRTNALTNGENHIGQTPDSEGITP